MTTRAQLPEVLPAKGRLTEREVRIAGLTSTALINLRAMSEKSSAGGTIQTAGGTMQLTQNDMQAALSILIERGEILLQQLDIELDREGQ